MVNPVRSSRCELCGGSSQPVMSSLGVCSECATAGFGASLTRIRDAHAANRRRHGLPEAPPRSEGGVRCPLCARGCSLAVGERGFCGLRVAVPSRAARPRLYHLAGRPSRGLLQWYRDPLPTNCVADWVCSGHERSGQHNLAVFYASCTLNCLGCQNWHFRDADPVHDPGMTDRQLAACADDGTYCVCFFGGDPASQMPHALATARRLAKDGVRICWETAGTQHPRLMDEAVELSLASGGIVKFDLKALDERLHVALTGGRNERTLDNFARAVARAAERPELPLVVASTLLVPGYVTPTEVGAIARFIASLDPDTPYALLAFAPSFAADDLPYTSRRHAEKAFVAARGAGLARIRIGNSHLLGGPDRGVLH
jgi:pyruvate formate lyase activating enzyme